jgi:hypothetical protein
MRPLQPTPYAAFDSAESTRLLNEIRTAVAAGISVIMENDSNIYDQGQLCDFWTRMSTFLKNEPGIIAYDIMNEPNTMGGGGGRGDALIWEPMSQAIVTAIRNNGDNTRIHVEGVDWSGPDQWPISHPTPWITDHANNIVYSAHHYPEDSGQFTASTGGAVQNPSTGCTADYRYTTTKAWYEAHVTGGMDFDAWNLKKLANFTQWLTAHNVKGDIGEAAWPDSQWMQVYQGLDAATATNEAALWNAHFGVPFLKALLTANLTLTYCPASGAMPIGLANFGELNMFQHAGVNGTSYSAGVYTPYVINTTNTQYAAFQTVGIWPNN